MNQRLLPVANLFGQLSDDQMAGEVLSHWTSLIQLQPCCDHHVAFVRSDVVLKLDHAAFSCIVEHMQRYHPHNEFTKAAAALLANIKVRKVQPKPEPEVRAALTRTRAVEAAQPDEASELTEPRWRAKVTFKQHGGRKTKGVYLIDEMRDLEDILENGPYWGAIKHVKIKLEYLLG